MSETEGMSGADTLSVATVTLVRDPEEDILMRAALAELSRQGLRVAVADGGSPSSFLDAIGALPGFELRRGVTGGLLAQVRASLDLARSWGTRRVLYTEPDKHSFFTTHLTGFLEAAAVNRDADLVLAARSVESFSTYPPIQQRVETMVNDLCADATGITADYSYGPFLFAASALPELADLAPDVGWGWRPYVFARIVAGGGRLHVVSGNFECPPSQRGQNRTEQAHRLRQLAQNAKGLSLAIDESLSERGPWIDPGGAARRQQTGE